MKISKKILKRIIREEYARYKTLNEMHHQHMSVEECAQYCIDDITKNAPGVGLELKQGMPFSMTILNIVKQNTRDHGLNEDEAKQVYDIVFEHFARQAERNTYRR
tara:strand:- start:924 stop:1238 length:315 start_codon:yes stop_codon:yes gene_type:complete